MREYVVNLLLKVIRKGEKKYSDEKLLEIRYGLESLYILITKSIIIFGISLLLGIFKNLLVFVIFYSIIRIPSFGAHASKSWICLFVSLILFIGLPYIGLNWSISFNIKCFMGLLALISMFLFAPSDTIKHPIVSKKRRITLKYISCSMTLIFILLSLLISNVIISNDFILALLLQSFIISPLAYRLFGQQYNYKHNFISL